MLLSDKDIRASIDAGPVVLEPYDPDMVQPSSVDVRIDRYFRVFENHRYPHIDPGAGRTAPGPRQPKVRRVPSPGLEPVQAPYGSGST